MVKARVVVDGIVQGVGYRALVKQVARQLGLKGAYQESGRYKSGDFLCGFTR